MPRPFRFGIQAVAARSATKYRDFVRKAEDLGYSTLFVPDHFVDFQLSPIPAMAVAAGLTERLRVGSLVLGNDYRHPAMVAKETAALDLLSDGRVELGLGAGWMRSDYDALGLPYDAAGVRVSRLAEAVQVVKRSWQSESFSFTGEHYQLKDYVGLPVPVQQPHPPIIIGGGGPRVLRLAGAEADIVGINPNLQLGAVNRDSLRQSATEEPDEKIEWVRAGAGARFGDIELQMRYYLAAVIDGPSERIEKLTRGYGLTLDEARTSPASLVGSVDAICDLLVERRERWGVSYIVLGGDVIDTFAPIVARLTGN